MRTKALLSLKLTSMKTANNTACKSAAFRTEDGLGYYIDGTFPAQESGQEELAEPEIDLSLKSTVGEL